MLTVYRVKAGKSSLEALCDALRSCKDEDPLHEVFVVTPSTPSAVALRRRIARLYEGLMNVYFGSCDALVTHQLKNSKLSTLPELGSHLAVQLVRISLEQAMQDLKSGQYGATGDRQNFYERIGLSLAARSSLEHIYRCFGRLDKYLGYSTNGDPASYGDWTSHLDRLLESESLELESRLLLEAFRRFKKAIKGRFADTGTRYATALREVRSRAPLGLSIVVYMPVGLFPNEICLLREMASVGRVMVVAGFTGDAESDRYLSRLLSKLLEGLPSEEVHRPDRDDTTVLADSSPKTETSGTPEAAYESPADALSLWGAEPEPGGGRSGPAPPLRPPLVGVRVLTAIDLHEEVRAAVRAAQRWVLEGYDPDSVAIACVTSDPYQHLISTTLEGCEIAHWGPFGPRLADTRPYRIVHTLLDLIEDDFRRDRVVELLHSFGAPPRAHANAGEETLLSIDAAVASRISAEAGIVGGVEEWKQKLDKFAKACNTEWKQEQAAELTGFIALLEVSTQHLRSIRGLASQPGDVRAAENGATWAQVVQELIGVLEMVGPRPLLATRLPSTQYGGTVGLRTAEVEEQAMEELRSRIEALSELDEWGSFPSWEDLRGELEALGQMPLGSSSGGSGLAVLALHDIVGVPADAVAIVGATAKSLPLRSERDPLLEPIEHLLGCEGLASLVPCPQEQRLRLFSVISAAERVLISHPMADLSERRAVPASRWLLEVAEELTSNDPSCGVDAPEKTKTPVLDTSNLAERQVGRFHVYVPSQWAGLHEAYPCDASEVRVRAVLEACRPCPSVELPQNVDRDVDRGEEASLSPEPSAPVRDRSARSSATEDPVEEATVATGRPLADNPPELVQRVVRGADREVFARRLARAKSWDSPAADEWWGVVDLSHHMASMAVVPRLSPTALEEWALCPYRYFLGSLLSVQELERPEEQVDVVAKQLGTAIHETLRQVLSEEIECSSALPPDPRGRLEWRMRRAGGVLDAQLAALTGSWRGDPARLAMLKKKVELGLEIAFLVHEALTSDLSSRPVALEQCLKEEVELDSGMRLSLEGRADRVDQTTDGSVIFLIDYKTGKLRSKVDTYRKSMAALAEVGDPRLLESKLGRGERLLEAPPPKSAKEVLAGGSFLQLPGYLLAVKRGNAIPLNTPPRSFAGIIWHIETATGANALFGFSFPDTELERVEEYIDAMASAIAKGIFPPVPGQPTYQAPGENCLRCPYDMVCTPDRAAIWESKSDGAAVEAFVRITAPVSEDTDDEQS